MQMSFLDPPVSTLIIPFISLVFAIAQNALNVKFANPRTMKEINEQVKSYKNELQSAKKLGDKKALRTLEKRGAYIKQRESLASSMQLRMMLSGIGLSIGTFWVLSLLFQITSTVAVIPASLLWGTQKTELSGFIWFVISSIFTNLIMRKVMGL